MAHLVRRPRNTWQPQYPTGIASSGLADGIVDVINSALRSSSLAEDTESLSGSIARVSEAPGQAFKVTGTNGYAEFSDAWSRIGTPLSLLWFYRINSTPGASNARVGGNFTVSSSGYGIITNNANRRGGWATSGANTILTGTNRIAAGTLCMDVLTIAGTSNPRSGVFYEDGKQTATGSGNYIAAAGNFRVGNDNGGISAQLASHYLAILWNRVLDPAEVWELWQNPWQIFSYRRRRLISLPSAAVTNADIAAVDGADVLLAGTTVTTGAAIAGIDAGDVEALAADNWTTAQVVVSDGSDISVIASTVTTGGAVSVIDSADVAEILASIGSTTSASLASIDGADILAISSATWMTGQIVVNDWSDVLAIGTSVTTGTAIAAIDSPDIVSVHASGIGRMVKTINGLAIA